MRLIISFNGNSLVVSVENIDHIINEGDFIRLNGALLRVFVDVFGICETSELLIKKSYLLAASEVYFDTRIEEVRNAKNSTSDL